MKNQLNTMYRHPICTIASLHDHFCLYGCPVPVELLYLVSVTSFFFVGRTVHKTIPVLCAGPVENAASYTLFQKLGLNIETIDIHKALADTQCTNVIAELDISIQSSAEKQRSYNITPIHTVVLIEHADQNSWYINEAVYSAQGTIEGFMRSPVSKIEHSNAIYLCPYETKKYVYRVASLPCKKMLEERILHVIQENIKTIISRMQKCDKPLTDSGIPVYTGCAAYRELINEISTLQAAYTAGSKEQRRVVSIRLMIIRRFLLSNLGAKDFFRTELAAAFRYYGNYVGQKDFDAVARELEKASPYWKPLAALLQRQAYTASDAVLFDKILANLTEIAAIEHKAANILQRITGY